MYTISLVFSRILIEGFIAGIIYFLYSCILICNEGIHTYVLIREDERLN